MRKLFAVLLILALALPMAALAESQDTTPVGSGDEPYKGTYEGEYDAEGKRSGYGTWAYRNYLYVGFWENDLPNGEGTLYWSLAPHSGYLGELYKMSVQGQWVDGYAQAEMRFRNYFDTSDGDQRMHVDVQVKAGYLASDLIVTELGWDYRTDMLFAGVPPFADAETDGSLPAPEFIYDDSWTYVDEADKAAKEAQALQDSRNEFQAYDDGTGAYDGAYDANGKRSGFGTWAYHNYLYVGNWENDLPNGEGTLYVEESPRSMRTITHGDWVDAFAEGSVEWTYFQWDYPVTYRLPDVKDGGYDSDGQILVSINNAKIFQVFTDKHGMSGVRVPPWGSDWVDVSGVNAPWDLYEKYPTGTFEGMMPKIENAGMGNTPGNLANAERGSWGGKAGMAALGDWVFFSGPVGKDTSAVYRMRPDGSQMIKLHESKWFSPTFQAIGDWLYVGDLYKMQAEDYQFTEENSWSYISGTVIDEWEYTNSYDGTNSLIRAKLDNTVMERLGAINDQYTSYYVIFADEDWVYVFYSNDAGPQLLTKMKTDGSGKVENHTMGSTSFDFPNNSGQVVGGRIYYTDIINGQNHLLSVDMNFTQAPVTIVRPEQGHDCGSFHVTEDYIYYGDMYDQYGPKETTSIVRINHDGSSPMVLIDGIKGFLSGILIADDWMMFKDGSMPYFMRLDGSDLHKLGEPFVPSNAPGITDSTGMWRYELLEDGSAMILGPGSKLKQTGKLSIPATVDKIPVTAIGENAFYGCEDFTGVTIPKSVTRIGDFAFFWCKGLTGVTIPEGVTSIGEGAFQWCTKIKKVTLPASLTNVGSGAFANCPTVKLSVAKKNEVFEIVDGALFDKQQNRPID